MVQGLQERPWWQFPSHVWLWRQVFGPKPCTGGGVPDCYSMHSSTFQMQCSWVGEKEDRIKDYALKEFLVHEMKGRSFV